VKNKFTLVELLTVICIISILASLLLPSLLKAREKALVDVCMSNQKQLAIAYTQYAAKNDFVAVAHRWYNSHSGTEGTHRWCDDPVDSRPLNKYLRGPQVSHCPADKGDPMVSWIPHEGETFGSSWVAPWVGDTMKAFKRSTNIGASTEKVRLVGFERPARKSIFHSIVLRHGRDWNDPSGKGKWHESKAPRFPINFVDGHAENFNFWWKKTYNYDPAWGKSEAWIIENLNIY